MTNEMIVGAARAIAILIPRKDFNKAIARVTPREDERGAMLAMCLNMFEEGIRI